MEKLNKLLKKRPVILDGGTGTELQKNGLPAGACPEKWCLQNQSVLTDIHNQYYKAGSDIVYTCTFGANRLKLAKYGVRNVKKTNTDLAKLARKAVGKECLIAGDIGPTGSFVEPFGDLPFEKAVDIFKEQASGLLLAGVDLFVIETMIDIQEARAALIAVKEITDKFTMVTMTYEKDGHTLNGTSPEIATVTLQSLGADAVGINCSLGPDLILDFVSRIKPYSKVPIAAKPNAGMPNFVNGKTVFDMNPDKFAGFGKKIVQQGGVLIGGCCGTSPDHIRKLKGRLISLKSKQQKAEKVSVLTSLREKVSFEHNKKLYVIGECINPTGKKQLQDELKQGKTALIREFAKAQKQAGVDLLDVNVGLAQTDESKILSRVVKFLSLHTDRPLVIDSANSQAVESALRVYPGRALVNSVSGQKEKLRRLLPVVSKYGAMFVALPLDDKGIPDKLNQRKDIVNRIYKKAREFGFTKDDIIVDGLVMAVSSFPESVQLALKTMKWARHIFGSHTICGISNVSFGLPKRGLINSAFLSIARDHGLSTAILNPLQEGIMDLKRADDVLWGQDKKAANFIYSYRESVLPEKKTTKGSSLTQRLYHSVLEGDKEDLAGLISSCLKEKVSPYDLINKVLIPAITQVGHLYDERKYFLPQLIASAEAVEEGFTILEKRLKIKEPSHKEKNVIILATVKGDIHDIGKNIVNLILRNHGFSVIDLGKDVPVSKIIQAIKHHKARVVGLSALMTTTMVNMQKVIEQARKENLNCRFIVGGAVVTHDYARSIGAEYARDGVEAVKVASRLHLKRGKI